jgi:glycosyltransferase involved in cell wall biosynthesis
MAKISAVLPTYNGEKFIRQAIESCLAQSWQDFELVVVNDASTDSTPEIVRSYLDQRIILVQNTKNETLPGALNTGFRQARGDYFIWMADDDRWAIDAFEILGSYLGEHQEEAGVFADYGRIDEDGNFIERISLDHLDPTQLKNTHAFLYRKEVFQALNGYDRQYFLIEDYEFWLRVWKEYKISYVHTENPLYYLRERGGSLTDSNRWKVHEMAARLQYERLGISRREYQKRLAHVQVQAAFEAYRNREFSVVRKRVKRAFFLDPACMLNRGLISISMRSFYNIFR